MSGEGGLVSEWSVQQKKEMLAQRRGEKLRQKSSQLFTSCSPEEKEGLTSETPA